LAGRKGILDDIDEDVTQEICESLHAAISEVISSAPSEQDKVDAARYREVWRIVGAMLSGGWRQVFHLHHLKPLEGVDLMKGSVAQHFEEAVDASIAARAAQEKANDK
jgi:hypothetical protein